MELAPEVHVLSGGSDGIHRVGRGVDENGYSYTVLSDVTAVSWHAQP